MITHAEQDHGQGLPSPTGRVIGFFPSPAQTDEFQRRLRELNFPAEAAMVLSGPDGIAILERSRNDFFMGDVESQMIKLGIQELDKGHLIVAVTVADRNEAERVAHIGQQHGGASFRHFGPFVSEQLTE